MDKEKTNEEESVMTVYEVSYVLLPSLALEQVPGKAESITDAVTSQGGAVVSFENPVLIDLAYPMTKVVGTTRHKATTGYFGWVKFEMLADGIEVVKKSLDANDLVLRYLIIKTVRENTLLNGKMMLKKEDKGKREDDVEVAPDEVVAEPTAEVSTPEEIDTKIDDLVIA